MYLQSQIRRYEADTYRPTSSNPSKIVRLSCELGVVGFLLPMSLRPGLNSSPNVMPSMTLNSDVKKKYTITRTATSLLAFKFKVAEPAKPTHNVMRTEWYTYCMRNDPNVRAYTILSTYTHPSIYVSRIGTICTYIDIIKRKRTYLK